MKEHTENKDKFFEKLKEEHEKTIFNKLCERLSNKQFFNNLTLHYSNTNNGQARIGCKNEIEEKAEYNIATIDWQPQKNRFKLRVGDKKIAEKIYKELQDKYPIVLKKHEELRIEAYLTNTDEIDNRVDLIVDSASY
jgi:hypothetical protein